MSSIFRRPRLGWLAGGAITVAVAYVLLLVHPQPLFAYDLSHAGIVLHATRPIPDTMRLTLERAAIERDLAGLPAW